MAVPTFSQEEEALLNIGGTSKSGYEFIDRARVSLIQYLDGFDGRSDGQLNAAAMQVAQSINQVFTQQIIPRLQKFGLTSEELARTVNQAQTDSANRVRGTAPAG